MRRLASLRAFAAAGYAHDPAGVLRLALSENPLGCSPAAADAARAELTRAHHYPHSDVEPLRSELADFYGVPVESVLVGNGADEMVLLAALATVEPGAVGATTARTFAGYAASLEIAGARVRTAALGATHLDVDAVIDAAAGAAVAIVGNPHNPLGTALTPTQVTALAAGVARAGAALVLDEAYAEFADPGTFGAGLPLVGRYGPVVVVRTFSKAYGLAGLRCGYAIGDPAVIATMSALRTALPYNVSRVAIAAARVALRDRAHLAAVVAELVDARDQLADGLVRLGIPVTASQTNFVLADFGLRAADVVGELADRHRIHVRDCTALGHPGWVRVGACARADVARVLDAFASTLRLVGSAAGAGGRA